MLLRKRLACALALATVSSFQLNAVSIEVNDDSIISLHNEETSNLEELIAQHEEAKVLNAENVRETIIEESSQHEAKEESLREGANKQEEESTQNECQEEAINIEEVRQESIMIDETVIQEEIQREEVVEDKIIVQEEVKNEVIAQEEVKDEENVPEEVVEDEIIVPEEIVEDEIIVPEEIVEDEMIVQEERIEDKPIVQEEMVEDEISVEEVEDEIIVQEEIVTKENVQETLTTTNSAIVLQEQLQTTSESFLTNEELITTSSAIYTITTASQLELIKYDLSGNYILEADLDLSGIEWNPLGTLAEPFTGTFDGGNHVISNLNMDRKVNYLGLFGVLNNAEIRNLIIVDSTIKGECYIGALAGYVQGEESKITNCREKNIFVTGEHHVGGMLGASDESHDVSNMWITECTVEGTIKGNDYYIGGLIGCVSGGVSDSQAYVTMEANNSVGAFAGFCKNAKIKDCFGEGQIIGGDRAGGMVGHSVDSTIERCVAVVEVEGNDYIATGIGCSQNSILNNSLSLGKAKGHECVGGALGLTDRTSQIITSYVAASVETEGKWIGGLVSNPFRNTIDRSYFNVSLVSLDEEKITDAALTTREMLMQNSFSNWDFTDVWTIDEGATYPYLRGVEKPLFEIELFDLEGEGTIEAPYLINCAEDLLQVNEKLDVNYRVTADLDLNDVLWNDVTIGNKEMPFTGHFDGAGYRISNLSINRTDDYVGLFGAICNGKVENITLNNASVKGRHNVGALAGYLTGEDAYITKCYVESSIVKGSNEVGGLIGQGNKGSISDCYAQVTVEGSSCMGGIVGSINGCNLNGNSGYMYLDGSGYYLGGMVGKAEDSHISGGYIESVIMGDSLLGGVIGSGFMLTVSDVWATGTIFGYELIGGFMAEVTHSTLKDCSIYVNTYGEGYTDSFIVRSMNCEIENCEFLD